MLVKRRRSTRCQRSHGGSARTPCPRPCHERVMSYFASRGPLLGAPCCFIVPGASIRSISRDQITRSRALEASANTGGDGPVACVAASSAIVISLALAGCASSSPLDCQGLASANQLQPVRNNDEPFEFHNSDADLANYSGVLMGSCDDLYGYGWQFGLSHAIPISRRRRPSSSSNRYARA
jgi:hypothetical protein